MHDDGLVLRCADPDPRSDAVARALTALRARFSPLTPVRAERGGSDGARVTDHRASAPVTVSLAEVFDPDNGFEPALRELLQRLGVSAPDTDGSVALPEGLDPMHAGLCGALARAAHAVARGVRARVSAIVPSRAGHVAQSPAGDAPADLHLALWVRPGGERGPRQAALVAATTDPAAIHKLAELLKEDPSPPWGRELYLDGLAWKASRRPTVAAPRASLPIVVDADRCTSCGLCARVCPTGYLGPEGRPATDDVTACTRCYDCVEACPVDALRPTYADDTGTRERALAWRPGWLSRLAGAPGPSLPAPFPPSYLLPRDEGVAPRYVLGLAVMTMQEHAAVLLRDGEIVGAVENERLARVRHAGWHPPGRTRVTAAVDPTICLEEALCRRPIRALLEAEGITLDDLDLIAVNGLHGRYVDRIDFTDASAAIPSVRAGRVLYLPHHLCHAASALRASGVDDAWVMTIDGRGDRECAAVFRAEKGELRPVDTVLALNDRSIGGVYEGVTRLLGFGSHGQGSVMALAAFGAPTVDVSAHLGVADDGAVVAHEDGINLSFADYARAPGAPLTQAHKDLAASLQRALERVAAALLRRSAGDGPLDALCLGGGVALNCAMNESLRVGFSPGVMFVQPGANDAGTALGAALEGWRRVAPAPPPSRALTTAALGPSFDGVTIARALQRAGLAHERVDDVATRAAELLAKGEVVCWFQGEMEFGPRALGSRSIVADPRDPAMHARVNGLKEREPWRPFGPSILAGHEDDWLERPLDSRFMLFTTPVKPERRAEVPAVVHVDGTTRPQVVHADALPRYHAMISAFYARTGVPMVLDTSFNRRGEPIVCTPDDAIESFVGLGADALVIGDFIARPTRAPATSFPPAEVLSAPTGRRLSLRLTARCDLACTHCTARDLRDAPDRDGGAALRALIDGRLAGCDELVILRGEAALRRDLPELLQRARAMGYRFIQLQTNGHALATIPWRDALISRVDSFEAQLLAADEAAHDALSGAPGSFRPTLAAIQALARSGKQLLVTIPLLRGNLRALTAIVALAHKLGARRAQFNFPRPVELTDRVELSQVPRLTLAAQALRPAALAALKQGMTVTTEAVPACLLPEELRASTDAREDFSRHRIDDLRVLHESVDEVRPTQRPLPPPCRGCSARERCGRTWALYLELFGSGELRPL
ncbi:MAG: carbamoyltransferase C-terminal domain-containing protein [Polyangiales bacterium]